MNRFEIGLFLALSVGCFHAVSQAAATIEQATYGPANHFFGYIGHVGNTPWNATGKYMLVLRTEFQDRMPGPHDAADIVLLDTTLNYAPSVVEQTRAWNPQQGTMLYWNPGAPETQFFFNDRDPETNKVFCVLYDLERHRRLKEYRFEDTPIGNSGVAQGGGWFLGLNYGRMDRLRRVTGYADAFDWTGDAATPANDGIFRVNVETGDKTLLVSFAALADQIRPLRPDVDDVPLFINHTLWSRDGQRVLFYLRGHWNVPTPRLNEFFTMHADGTHIQRHETFPGGHPEWAPGHHIVGAVDGKQVVYDTDRRVIVNELGNREVFPKPEGDIALSPDGRWFVNGYKDKDRNVYVVYNMETGSHHIVAALKRGVYLKGDVRLDPSPCWRRDAKAFAVPAIAPDGSRQTYVIHLEADLAPGKTDAEKYDAIDTSLFLDNIGHWQRKYGRDRNDPRFRTDQIVEIADNMLRYQHADGGWPKEVDWLADISYEEVRKIRGPSLERSTLDNHSTFSQIAYLSKVYLQTGDNRYINAAERGIDYILQKQHASGGWAGSDVEAITFNDDVMTGVMALFLDIQQQAPHFEWIDDARRAAVSKSLRRAIECTLACQIVVNGQKTAWCQQHDHEILAPVSARSYELASICSRESTDVLRFLMSLPDQDERTKDAIRAGVAWLRSVAVTGMRLERVPIEPARFENHTATFDNVVRLDDAAPPIWARFYDIRDNRPLFCRRDGTRVNTLAEVDLERRTGYAWYGSWPRKLIERDYPAWRKGLEE